MPIDGGTQRAAKTRKTGLGGSIAIETFSHMCMGKSCVKKGAWDQILGMDTFNTLFSGLGRFVLFVFVLPSGC